MLKVDENFIASYDEVVQKINDAIVKIDECHYSLNSIMDSGKWQGDAHEISKAVLVAVENYFVTFNDDYTKLKEHVATLVKNVDDFHETSPSVKSISG